VQVERIWLGGQRDLQHAAEPRLLARRRLLGVEGSR